MMIKWIFDRIVAFIGLLCLWPVLLVVAVLIKIKMPGGPAFFVQKRVGKDGKLFDCHKFRTMTVKHNGSTVSVAGDSRITPFGATLRHYKLDELPGLWDVLIGNMSFVGPRPDVPGYADKLTGDDRDVLKLRPGITGPATLKYRLEDEMIAEYVAKQQAAGDSRPMQEIAVEYNDKVIYPDKVRLNCYYYRHYSFIKDIQMIFCTVLGLFAKWTKDINSCRDFRVEAIAYYCGEVHKKINGFLRGTAEIGPFSNYLDTIQAMLSVAPLLPYNIILYRALPLHVIKTVLSEMDMYGSYLEKGFLSTSLNLNGIMNFVKSINEIVFEDIEFQVLKLYIPQGTPALYIEDIEGSGMGREELELILPRDATIKKLRSPYWDERFGFWIHECSLEYGGLH